MNDMTWTREELHRAAERLARCELIEHEHVEHVALDGELVYLAHDLLERLVAAEEDTLVLAEPLDPFDAWWALYPRKVAKKAARRAWERLSVGEQEAASMALPAHVELWRVEGRGSVVIPHPATWLNGARWDDELEYRPSASPGQQRQVEARARMQNAVRGRPPEARQLGEGER